MSSKRCFSYVRVSTLRQGQTGTSLAEQTEAINRHAERWNLRIIKRFEEKETAAKLGRPVFAQMIRALNQGEADGVIIHKIDRSARNLKDWADLGEIIDRGIEVHFANESLDLNSRGGRLSADIQAVVAADYIRNLREETRKGFYGRLKQGLYPRPAPIGYIDCGKGQPKKVDPIQGPLVRKAFEMYATGGWSLVALSEKMYEFGLRSKNGKKVTINGMSCLLHNPFYIGLIRVRIAGEMFRGAHSPIISKVLFDQVQQVLSGKNLEKKSRHFFLFRRLLFCIRCQATLIGESQKGHIYYRCHTKDCPEKTIRQEVVETAFMDILQKLRFSELENRYFRDQIKIAYQDATAFREAQTKALNLQTDQLKNRLSKLADAYIEGVLDKNTYLEKKNQLLMEEKATKEKLDSVDEDGHKVLQRVEQFLELINDAYLSYKLATDEEKRDFVKIITSNLIVEEKTVSIKLKYPFQVVFDRQDVPGGSPQRGVPRTLSTTLSQLCSYFKDNELFPEPEKVKERIPLDQQFLSCSL